MTDVEFDDNEGFDGGGKGNIFDVDDVFDPEANDLAPMDLGETTPGDEAEAVDDGYVPDVDMKPADETGSVIRYGGEDWIAGIPSRRDLVDAANVAAGNPTLSGTLRDHISSGRSVFFLPTDVEETNVYQGGVPVYALKLFGPLMDGSKAEVTITGIDVYFDVAVPDRPASGALLSPAGQKRLRELDSDRVAQFEAHLRQLLSQAGVTDSRIDSHSAYPIKGYHTEPKLYRRVFTANLQQRKKAVAAVRGAGFETASDDRSSYYRKAAREKGLPLSSWATLAGYEYSVGDAGATGDRLTSPLCEHVFRVPVDKFRPLVDTMGPKDKREAAARARDKAPLLVRDRTLVLTWDIETHSDRGLGDLPRAVNPGDVTFMLCMTAHWKDDPRPLAQICLVDVEMAPSSDWITVVCGSQQNLLKAFALCWRSLAPDICAGFNDSEYDWPFIVEKANKLGILAEMWNTMSASPRRTTTNESVMRWNYQREKRVKISAEESFLSSYLKIPGTVAIDARVCFKKLYPKSETPKAGSLKFYLEVSGLPGKADMPIKRMWRYYEVALAIRSDLDAETPGRIAESAEHMRHVGHYCVVDALRCQSLLVRRNIINDYREVSTLAFVSLADSHYYAGGMKVCNLLGANAEMRNILFSMIPVEREMSGKYPGAYVFPPEKGIAPDAGRHMMADAAAADYRAARDARDAAIELDAEHTARALALGQEPEPTRAAELRAALAAAETKLAEVKLSMGDAFSAMAPDRPVTGLDFSSLYPSIIMAYNLSPEKMLFTRADAEYWIAQGRKLHKIEFQYGGRLVEAWSVLHENKPDQIGLYPAVLIDLYNRRADVKAVQATHGVVKELIELIIGRAQKAVGKGAAPKPTDIATAAAALRGEAETEQATTAAAMAPGAPPPRVSPGSTVAEELADLKRRNKNAREQVEGLHRLEKLAQEYASTRTAQLTPEVIAAAISAEYERASFDWTCANSKQNAIKVYMNTFYGEAGNSLSPFFELALAGGVTSAGQYNIKLVADFVRGRGFRIKYGDSVTGDTGLIIRLNGVPRTARIDELVPDGGWTPYGDKEAAVVPGLEIWQDGGFTPVARVIRHACGKTVTRILTHTGVVDCTADHSLLRPDSSEVSPNDVDVGTELLHADDTALISALDQRADDTVTLREAFAMGLFAAEGSCGRYDCASGVKYSWAINNQDLDLLNEAAAHLPFPTRILNTMASSAVYKLVPVGGIKGPTLRYRELFYNAHREKRIPPCILGAELEIVAEFWRGFYAGDGDVAQQRLQTNWRIDQKGKEMCTGLWLLGRRLGWQVSLNDRADKPDIFRMTFSDVQDRKRPLTQIKKKRDLTEVPAFVYDLETGSHHFHVGPGNLVVHNTDSLYLQPPEAVFAECDLDYAEGRLTREEYWSAMVRITMRALNQIRDEVNAMLTADNGTKYLKMAYEEVLFPVVFTGKKKYFGIPHLNEVNFRPKKLFIKGIDVVKQGQPGLAREIGNRIMWACMDMNNKRSVRQIVEDVLRDAVENGAQWNFEHFVKTDAWKPQKDNKPVHRFIARMRARHAAEVAESTRVVEAGGAPKPYQYELPEPGERFRYIIAKTGAAFDLHGRKSALKKGDRMEFAHVAKETGLEIDVPFYMISNVVGLCARFINCEAQFQPASAARLSDKELDKASQTAAKKYLEGFVKGLSNLDSDMLRRRGYAYRRAYTAASGVAHAALAGTVGSAAAEMLHGPWVDFEVFDDESEDATVQALWDSAKALAEDVAERGREEWCVALGRALGFEPNGRDSQPGSPETPRRAGGKGPATALYGAATRPAKARGRPAGIAAEASHASQLNRIEASIRAEMIRLLPTVSDVALRYEADLSRLVQGRRAVEHDVHPDIGDADAGAAAADDASPTLTVVTPDDTAGLMAFRRLWFDAVGVQLTRVRNEQFARHVAAIKNRRVGGNTTPTRADRDQIIASAASRMRVSGELDTP